MTKTQTLLELIKEESVLVPIQGQAVSPVSPVAGSRSPRKTRQRGRKHTKSGGSAPLRSVSRKKTPDTRKRSLKEHASAKWSEITKFQSGPRLKKTAKGKPGLKVPRVFLHKPKHKGPPLEVAAHQPDVQNTDTNHT